MKKQIKDNFSQWFFKHKPTIVYNKNNPLLRSCNLGKIHNSYLKPLIDSGLIKETKNERNSQLTLDVMNQIRKQAFKGVE